MTDGVSAADVMAMTRGTDGFLDGNGIIILILFFLIFGFGGGAWGNNSTLTQAELQSGLYNQTANADRLAMMQNQFETQKDVLENRYQGALQNQAIQAQQQACCCETQKEILGLQAENYKNTCNITNAIHKEGEETRALITANTIQELRDQNTAYQLQLSNQAQTANIISQLRPTPIPAYLTCSPYTTNNCVYNNGCNCNI